MANTKHQLTKALWVRTAVPVESRSRRSGWKIDRPTCDLKCDVDHVEAAFFIGDRCQRSNRKVAVGGESRPILPGRDLIHLASCGRSLGRNPDV